MISVRRRLRNHITEPGLVPIAGAYDALSARIAAAAGIKVLHAGGYNLSAAHLGLPDVGYLTLMENANLVRGIAATVDIPVIADADDGYGNHLNARRTIIELERAGAAGLHIEDQQMPKRCGHMQGKRIISKDAMVQKLKAVLDARVDDDFVVIARTDALQVNGFEDALERAHAYRETGADVTFLEAVRDDEQAARVPNEVDGPCLYNWVRGGASPEYSFDQVKKLGYKLLLYSDLLGCVATTLRKTYGQLATTGEYGETVEQVMPFDEFNELIGLDEAAALDDKYRTPGE
jgi:2-methylisocitrate lyase-like PEP mutase family enzyme